MFRHALQIPAAHLVRGRDNFPARSAHHFLGHHHWHPSWRVLREDRQVAIANHLGLGGNILDLRVDRIGSEYGRFPRSDIEARTTVRTVSCRSCDAQCGGKRLRLSRRFFWIPVAGMGMFNTRGLDLHILSAAPGTFDTT